MNPEDVDAVLDRATRLLEAGRPAESLRCLDEVDGQSLEADERIEWGSLRAWALSEVGRDQEAVDLLEELLEEAPDSARLIGTLGVVLSNNDELEDAREALEQAVSLAPEDEVALANLALVYEKLRDYRHAARLYDQALERGADIDWILARKAAVLTELGEYSEAKSTLHRYLSLVPDDAAQWIALGILHSDDDEFERAYECYRAAERLDADSASLRLNWGVSAVGAGDLPAAYAQLAELQRLEPHSVRWRLLRAFILEEEGDTAGAQRIYERMVGRSDNADHADVVYALEMAMDFFSRHSRPGRCARLLRRAYQENACSVELCEAYREATGEHLEKAYWFSMMIEADYRPGLVEVRDEDEPSARPYTRFVRNYQVIANDHDEAVGLVLEFAGQMGESHATIREFVGSEPMEDTHRGIYEVEPESYVFTGDQHS